LGVFVPDLDALLQTLERFAATLTRDYAIDDVLRELAEQVAVVVGVMGAGVILVRRGELAHAVAPLDAIAHLERVVEDQQTGPCVDVLRSRQPVMVSDLTDAEFGRRWPEYVAQAEAGGIRAVAVVPMFTGNQILGVLGLYDSRRRTWTDEDLRAARVLADTASSYLVHSVELDQERTTNAQLQTALTSRILIEQAKGVLAEARGIGVDEAFQVLRKHSRDHNALIHDVAAAVVNLHLRP
jgi:GAF domain-containing protein